MHLFVVIYFVITNRASEHAFCHIPRQVTVVNTACVVRHGHAHVKRCIRLSLCDIDHAHRTQRTVLIDTSAADTVHAEVTI